MRDSLLAATAAESVAVGSILGDDRDAVTETVAPDGGRFAAGHLPG